MITRNSYHAGFATLTLASASRYAPHTLQESEGDQQSIQEVDEGAAGIKSAQPK